MVSPNYPSGGDQTKAAVVLRVMVSRTGHAFPIDLVSGPPSLGAEAMDAVRLWKYKPYMSANGPVDVVTQVLVDFVPGRPGGVITHPNR
jgi:protein TonB